MAIALQPSLFDAALDEPPGFGSLVGGLRRTPLTQGAWVDHLPGWLRGSEELFLELVEAVPWKAERRQMYDRA